MQEALTYAHQMMQAGESQISYVAVFPSRIQGQGVFAARAIERGAVILRVDDSRVVDADHPLRPEVDEDLVHRDFLPDGTVVLMRAPERYINHSCDPNCFYYSVNRRRFVMAKRDIAAGEEILADYSLNAIDGDVWECRCGSQNCRGVHKCDFFALSRAIQFGYLPYLDPWFAAVHASRIERLLTDSLEASCRPSE